MLLHAYEQDLRVPSVYDVGIWKIKLEKGKWHLLFPVKTSIVINLEWSSLTSHFMYIRMTEYVSVSKGISKWNEIWGNHSFATRFWNTWIDFVANSRFYKRDIRAVDIEKMVPWRRVLNMFCLWILLPYTYNTWKSHTSVREINNPNQKKTGIKPLEKIQIQVL